MNDMGGGTYGNPLNEGSISNHRYLDMMTVRPSQGARLTAAAALSAFNPATMGPSPAAFSATKPSTGHASRAATNHHHSHNQSGSHAVAPNFPPLGDKLSAMPSTHLTTQTHTMTSQPVLTVKKNVSTHSTLLIEPILLPNLQHVHIDTPQDLEESCLFYPNGHKNRNIRREIESSMIKHHILENSKIKTTKLKSKFRVVPKDPYADAKGPPLFYGREPDKDMAQLLKSVREKEKQIVGTIQVRI
jgi:hypothetical protein